MSQSLDREIEDYLARKENLRLTFEIGRYATQLQHELFKRFWKQLSDAITKARPRGMSSDAFLIRDPTVHYGECVALRAIPKEAGGQQRQLAVTIEHESTKQQHDIYVGLHWSVALPTNHTLYEREPLRDLKQHFDAAGSDFFDQYWVGGRYVHRLESPTEFLCTFTEDPPAILDPLTSTFWTIVEENKAHLDKVNRAVALI